MANLEETPRQTQGGGGGISITHLALECHCVFLEELGEVAQGRMVLASFLTSLAPQPGL